MHANFVFIPEILITEMQPYIYPGPAVTECN